MFCLTSTKQKEPYVVTLSKIEYEWPDPLGSVKGQSVRHCLPRPAGRHLEDVPRPRHRPLHHAAHDVKSVVVDQRARQGDCHRQRGQEAPNAGRRIKHLNLIQPEID